MTNTTTDKVKSKLHTDELWREVHKFSLESQTCYSLERGDWVLVIRMEKEDNGVIENKLEMPFDREAAKCLIKYLQDEMKVLDSTTK